LGLRPGSLTKSVGSARFSTSPQTLSGRVRSGLLCVRVEEFGTGRARLCRLSGLVVSFLSSTTRTRPNTSAPATGSPTKSGPCEIPLLRLRPDQTRPDQTHVGQNPYMSRLSGQVYDQTKSADLSETQAVRGSGLVGSVYSGIKERHDQTRPATKCGRAGLVECGQTQSGPHGLRQRRGSPTKCGRAGLVECGRCRMMCRVCSEFVERGQ